MKETACALCFTGHREIPRDKVGFVRERLREEIKKAVEAGFIRMISGFADGADLMFAEIITQLKSEYPQLTLEAAIPYRGRMKTKNADFHRLLGQCGGVTVVSENYYKGCFLDRNRYMLKNSNIVIAVYDGRESGGTYYTINLARKLGREIVIIGV